MNKVPVIVPTELPTDPIISISEPTETQSPETQPRETHAAIEPTESIDPTEPTIPPLGESAGSRFECYYSDEYDDFLNYYVHIPEDAVVNMPLIVYLHGDGEVDSKRHQERNCSCSGWESKMRPVLSQARAEGGS